MVIIPPFVELLMDADEYAKYCGPDSTNIERHHERIKNAQIIEKQCNRDFYDDEYYYAVINILEEQPRLALYLPIYNLKDGPVYFCLHYLKAWYKCLAELDDRNSYEVEPNGDNSEKTIKAIHLLPWLLSYQFLSERDFTRLLSEYGRSKCFMQDIHDILPELKEHLHSKLYREVEERVDFGTFDRKKAKRKKSAARIVDLAKATGPFDDNLFAVSKYLDGKLPEGKIAIIGGAPLKGCACTDDVFRVKYLSEPFDAVPPNKASAFLDTAWALNVDSIEDAQEKRLEKISSLIRNETTRANILRSIEKDLCRSDLLRNMSEGGESAFFDDHYRRIATALFAKYVWLPKPVKT